MRIFTLSLFTIIAVKVSIAQNTFPTTGNAGIGTTSPSGNLHIRTYDYNKIILDVPNTSGVVQQKFMNSSQTMDFALVGSSYPISGYIKTSGAFLSTNAAGGISIANYNSAGVIRFYTGGTTDGDERFRIDQTGKIFGYNISRIGNVRDSSISLDPVTGEFQFAPILTGKLSFADTRVANTTPALYNNTLQTHLKGVSAINLTGTTSSFVSLLGLRAGNDNQTGKAHELAFADNSQIYIRSGNTEGWESWKKLIIEDQNGNVGIGTSNPQSKLAVNGDIYAKKIKVTQLGWPDYVFSSNYNLPSIYEVEAFIKKYQHLPGVVPAEEVERNGLDLGDNQASLLKKIEELTLYIIQQQHHITQQQHRIDQLQSEKTNQSSILLDLMQRVKKLEAE